VNSDQIGSSAVSEIQLEILDFIRGHVAERGYPPSVREISRAVGPLSSSTVHGHLVELERKGWIVRVPNQARSISVVAPAA
jgi:repressor LexA